MTKTDLKSHPPLDATATRRVLVLESDRLVKALILEWLHLAGCETFCAHDAAGAGAIRRAFDVVLADVPAPLKAAREAVDRLARAVPGTPVIAMSADMPAQGRSAADALARELGAVAVLVKPFNRESLLYAIHQAGA